LTSIPKFHPQFHPQIPHRSGVSTV
jgi:hypothetical protein